MTAEEFKNCGVPVDEFYGKLADSPEVLAAAKSASLIIYEGHLAYQDLIDVPSARRATAPDSYFDEELDDLEDGGARPAGRAAARRRRRATPAGGRGRAGQSTGCKGRWTGCRSSSCKAAIRWTSRCLWRIDELGGVAVIGSVTPIHSGSGSALVQAAGRRRALSRGHAGRSPPRRAELPVLPGRSEEPAAARRSRPRAGGWR